MEGRGWHEQSLKNINAQIQIAFPILYNFGYIYIYIGIFLKSIPIYGHIFFKIYLYMYIYKKYITIYSYIAI